MNFQATRQLYKRAAEPNEQDEDTRKKTSDRLVVGGSVGLGVGLADGYFRDQQALVRAKVNPNLPITYDSRRAFPYTNKSDLVQVKPARHLGVNPKAPYRGKIVGGIAGAGIGVVTAALINKLKHGNTGLALPAYKKQASEEKETKVRTNPPKNFKGGRRLGAVAGGLYGAALGGLTGAAFDSGRKSESNSGLLIGAGGGALIAGTGGALIGYVLDRARQINQHFDVPEYKKEATEEAVEQTKPKNSVPTGALVGAGTGALVGLGIAADDIRHRVKPRLAIGSGLVTTAVGAGAGTVTGLIMNKIRTRAAKTRMPDYSKKAAYDDEPGSYLTDAVTNTGMAAAGAGAGYLIGNQLDKNRHTIANQAFLIDRNVLGKLPTKLPSVKPGLKGRVLGTGLGLGMGIAGGAVLNAVRGSSPEVSMPRYYR